MSETISEMPWWFAVVEAEHELQNPTSPEKIRLLGERMRLRPGSEVLDVASGKAGPAIVLAESFGCRITCVEPVALIASSEDDWDRYESLHWHALEEWLAANADDPAAEEFRERGARQRERYLRGERDLLGWAIIVGRRR